MSIRCKIFGHDWQGCVCSRCGSKRYSDHSYKGCRCSICGSVRDAEHTWSGCICTVCGKTRDEEHRIEGCICTLCKKPFHTSEKGWCTVCGAFTAATDMTRFLQKNYNYPNCRCYFVTTYRTCNMCGTGTPHLVQYYADAESYISGAGVNKSKTITHYKKGRERSSECVVCGNVHFCEKCGAYVPVLAEYDDYSDKTTFLCAACREK